jgi:hypothetical protein
MAIQAVFDQDRTYPLFEELVALRCRFVGKCQRWSSIQSRPQQPQNYQPVEWLLATATRPSGGCMQPPCISPSGASSWSRKVARHSGGSGRDAGDIDASTSVYTSKGRWFEGKSPSQERSGGDLRQHHAPTAGHQCLARHETRLFG